MLSYTWCFVLFWNPPRKFDWPTLVLTFYQSGLHFVLLCFTSQSLFPASELFCISVCFAFQSHLLCIFCLSVTVSCELFCISVCFVFQSVSHFRQIVSHFSQFCSVFRSSFRFVFRSVFRISAGAQHYA